MHRFTFPLTAALIALPLSVLAEQGSFETGGVTIRYTDEGTGPAVILLHSFAGSSVLWDEAGLANIDGFRTLTFDARGHGASDKPTDPTAYGAQMVDDLRALMAARGIEEAHIIGYSMGAETALKFASLYPDQVLSLTVAGSGWSGEPEAEVYTMISGALSGVASFADFMAAMAPDAEMSNEAAAAMGAMIAAHGIDPAQEAAPLAAVAAGLPEIIDLTADDFAQFEFPVLGLAGEADPERANVEALAGPLSDYRFVMIPEADHLAAPLSPVFTEAVTTFLAH